MHVVLPAYQAAETVELVARSMPVESADRALLVDDASRDETSAVALRNGLDVLRLPANRGYGGNQKACYVRAILDGADAVVMVHADNQYDPALVAQMVKPIEAGIADVVIGSRLLEDEAIAGGMPRWKWVGNRFLTALENAAFRRGYSEYHTGYRAMSTDFLRSIPFLRNSDGFVFDQEIFAQIVARRARVDRAADPHALLPRGVHRVVPVERRVRPADAAGARALPARRARRPLAAAAPAGRPARARDTPGRHAVTEQAGAPVARTVARNTAVQLAGKAVVMLVGLASVAVTTRYLGASGYGKLALAFAFVQTFGLLADAGLLTVVVREISRVPERTDELVGSVLALRLALSLAVVPLAALASLALPYDRDVRVAILIAGGSLVLGLANGALVAVFQARLRMGRAALADVAGRAGRVRGAGGRGRARPRLLCGGGHGGGRGGGRARGQLGPGPAAGASAALGRPRRVARAARGRAAGGSRPRGHGDLLSRGHLHHLAVPRLRRGGRVLARLPRDRAARRVPCCRDDLRVPPALALPRLRRQPRARRRDHGRGRRPVPRGRACRSRPAGWWWRRSWWSSWRATASRRRPTRCGYCCSPARWRR